MANAGRKPTTAKRPSKEQFELDEASSIPIWLQLKNRFIYLITSGFYMPRDKLPTVRGLAADLEINYNTVSKVYQSLEEDGYVESVLRQGAFVRDVSDKPGISLDATAEMVTAEYFKRCAELGMTLEDIEKRFNESLAAARRARGGRGAGNVGTQEQQGLSGRILEFSGASDFRQRTTGNGA